MKTATGHLLSAVGGSKPAHFWPPPIDIWETP